MSCQSSRIVDMLCMMNSRIVAGLYCRDKKMKKNKDLQRQALENS